MQLVFNVAPLKTSQFQRLLKVQVNKKKNKKNNNKNNRSPEPKNKTTFLEEH